MISRWDNTSTSLSTLLVLCFFFPLNHHSRGEPVTTPERNSTPNFAKTFDHFYFIRRAMSGGTGPSNDAAPVVTAELDHRESSLLRELVGDQEALREVEMGEDSGSEPSEPESNAAAAGEMEEEWEGKGCGMSNFRRAAPGAGQHLSTQEFFRRGAQLSMSEINIFGTPGKTPTRGALPRSLSAAASSLQ